MTAATLTVKLRNGQTLYFTAGPVIGDAAHRVDLLREAIENDSLFTSVDLDGTEHSFQGSEVAHYALV
ncbi:hypothetical protein [Corynebacterium endometrii]|jgi:hypothetical protein|uniref:Uncharacterized protein n=1 Tax=Corynebacterium endometrii TaxID=2488819 RepID=A0A4V1CE96_9CORY|nr:hypothetical protein [Corynebacterium endometrii]QCB27338.1 hypothetical protein CENDO_00135 [Corynebacterium endometrii]